MLAPGQKQRLGLARALILRPKVIIADEALASLDMSMRSQLINLMLELQEASRLPERLGEDFVRAANTIIHCEGKVIVAGIGKSGHIGKKIAATLAS